MPVPALLLGLLALVGCAYLIAAAALVGRFARRRETRRPGLPGVTVLRPLHGADAGLYENLISACEQDFPVFQVVLGVRQPDDPAIAIVRRVVAERPGSELDLVVDPAVRGTNLKVSNLENMLAVARHPVLVIADSDMRVTPSYLAEVTAPLADPAVGLVTCLYRGIPVGGMWSTLGALFVNHGFLPSAVLGDRLEPGNGCFGATMALRRDVFDEIGGLAPLRDQLADDYALGAMVRRSGRRVVLSPHLVDTMVAEPSLAALFRHELRWQRTIRLLAPWGFVGSVVTHPTALALLAAVASGLAWPFLALVGLTFAVRVATVRAVDRALGTQPTPVWLLPPRDVLSFTVFVASFCGHKIAWRGRAFRLARDGRLIPDGDPRT
jgi:ceramide glucosyltransferase